MENGHWSPKRLGTFHSVFDNISTKLSCYCCACAHRRTGVDLDLKQDIRSRYTL